MKQLMLYFAAFIFIAGASARQVCYDGGVGCFSDDPPFDNFPLPEDPVELQPKYLLLRKNQTLQVIERCDQLDTNELVVATHGFSGNYENTYYWNSKITDGIFKVRPNANVLFIDWERGAQFGSGKSIYHQPASNVRVVAKIVSLWLQENPLFDSTKAHCIGFSLGAHICGVTAKRLGTKWGRLSAIDPAGPAFIKDDPVARVDISDGIVVDVMHVSWISLGRQIGHKDFYVNNARVQPGCLSRRKRGLLDNVFDIFGCSHYRAALLYSETIEQRHDCVFQACPCPTQQHFDKGYCRDCHSNDGQLLGYRSIESNKTGIFYVATSGEEPYCI